MGLIGDLFVRLGVKKEGFDKGMEEAGKKTSGFGNIVKKIGPLIAGAFAVDKIKDFIANSIELASKAEGIEKAFNRLGDPNLLDGLRKSVKGTVNDVELMQKAVQAKNLGVPIQQLGKLFEFATQRASDTGESVDYLVNSIVTGIGRKSPMILDNLGISAIALKENLDGVGLGTASVGQVAEAVGKIIDKEMGNAENATMTYQQQTDALAASWDNFSLAVGKGLLKGTGAMQALSNELNNLTRQLNNNVGFWQKLMGVFNTSAALMNNIESDTLFKLTDRLIEQGKVTLDNFEAIQKLNVATEQQKQTLIEYAKNILNAKKKEEEQAKVVEKEKGALEKLRIELKEVKAAREALTSTTDIAESNIRIAQIEQEIKALEALGRAALDSGEKLKKLQSKGLDTPLVSGGEDDQMLKPSSITEEAMNEMRANLEEFIDLTGAVQNAVFDLSVTIGESVGQAFSGLFKWKNFFQSIKNIFGNFLMQMGEAMVAYGVAMIALRLAPVEPFAAIGAGVALIAAGAIISNLGSSGPFGGGVGAPTAQAAPTNIGETGQLEQTLVTQVSGEDLQFVLSRTDQRQER